MGAVFASAARAPLTSLASVVEMTGDFTLTLPVMLAVAVATALSRALSYGTIYTTKLLRRGTDIDRPPAARRVRGPHRRRRHAPFPRRCTIAPSSPATGPDRTAVPGPITLSVEPQALFANESLAQALRQLVLYGRDGLPVISAEGSTCRAGSPTRTCCKPSPATCTPPPPPRKHSTPPHWPSPARKPPSGPADPAARLPDPGDHHPARIARRRPGTRQHHLAARLIPVTVLDNHTLRDPDPGITLAPGDRVNLLAPNHATRNQHTRTTSQTTPQLRGPPRKASSRIRRPANATRPRPDAAQEQLAPPGSPASASTYWDHRPNRPASPGDLRRRHHGRRAGRLRRWMSLKARLRPDPHQDPVTPGAPKARLHRTQITRFGARNRQQATTRTGAPNTSSTIVGRGVGWLGYSQGCPLVIHSDSRAGWLRPAAGPGLGSAPN